MAADVLVGRAGCSRARSSRRFPASFCFCATIIIQLLNFSSIFSPIEAVTLFTHLQTRKEITGANAVAENKSSRTRLLEQKCSQLGYIHPNPCHCHCPNCPDPKYKEPAACPPATEPPPPPPPERPGMPPPDELAPLPKVPPLPAQISEAVNLFQLQLNAFCAGPPDPRECVCNCPPCDHWEPKLPSCQYNNERLCTQINAVGGKEFVCFVPEPGWGDSPEESSKPAGTEPAAAAAPAEDPCGGDPEALPEAKFPPPIDNSAPTLTIPENEPPKIGPEFAPKLD
ncbi:unnamed protein product [Amoebophrya sp. A120]|nr:unnamed protein product [Amoebophrya sp. A120]|eukprot:GSA120T00023288001.1